MTPTKFFWLLNIAFCALNIALFVFTGSLLSAVVAVACGVCVTMGPGTEEL